MVGPKSQVNLERTKAALSGTSCTGPTVKATTF